MDSKNILLYTHLPAKKADLIILILASQQIDSRVEKNKDLFDILVADPDKKNAMASVTAYFKENKGNLIQQQLEKIPLSSFSSTTTFFIMGLLVFIHLACSRLQMHEQAVSAFGASALYILQGDTYRAITALFLHADARHLLGNLAGMILFAAPVISVSGFGTGSFILLFSGTLGNLFNACLHRTAHLSIGSSTAVMGAAGLLAAFQFTQKKPFRFNNLVPVFSGAVLVALFSQGERTDVWAHVFGFLCGLGSGVFFFPLNRVMKFRYKDPLFLALTIAILLSAFVSGTGWIND